VVQAIHVSRETYRRTIRRSVIQKQIVVTATFPKEKGLGKTLFIVYLKSELVQKIDALVICFIHDDDIVTMDRIWNRLGITAILVDLLYDGRED
jgi:beta-lactamase superfamily II metal-dependent hydrolase